MIAFPEERLWLSRYLATAVAVLAGLQWLLLSTLSRLAAAPNLEGTPRAVIEAVGQAGVFLVSPAFVLTAVYFGWCVAGIASSARSRASIAFAMYLGIFAGLAVAHALFPRLTWLNIAFNTLSLVAILWASLRFMIIPGSSLAARITVLLVGVAYAGQFVYILDQSVDLGEGTWEGGLAALQAGELAAVMAPFALFVAVAVSYGQWRNPRRWIIPVTLGLVIAGGSIADMALNQGFTAVFAIWSVGMQLYLPWPLYAVALSFFAYSVLTCFSRDTIKAAYANPNIGTGMLLTLFGGYRLLLPYQHMLALLSLLLLTGMIKPFEPRESAAPTYHETAAKPREEGESLSKPAATT